MRTLNEITQIWRSRTPMGLIAACLVGMLCSDAAGGGGGAPPPPFEQYQITAPAVDLRTAVLPNRQITINFRLTKAPPNAWFNVTVTLPAANLTAVQVAQAIQAKVNTVNGLTVTRVGATVTIGRTGLPNNDKKFYADTFTNSLKAPGAPRFGIKRIAKAPQGKPPPMQGNGAQKKDGAVAPGDGDHGDHGDPEPPDVFRFELPLNGAALGWDPDDQPSLIELGVLEEDGPGVVVSYYPQPGDTTYEILSYIANALAAAGVETEFDGDNWFTVYDAVEGICATCTDIGVSYWSVSSPGTFTDGFNGPDLEWDTLTVNVADFTAEFTDGQYVVSEMVSGPEEEWAFAILYRELPVPESFVAELVAGWSEDGLENEQIVRLQLLDEEDYIVAMVGMYDPSSTGPPWGSGYIDGYGFEWSAAPLPLVGSASFWIEADAGVYTVGMDDEEIMSGTTTRVPVKVRILIGHYDEPGSTFGTIWLDEFSLSPH